MKSSEPLPSVERQSRVSVTLPVARPDDYLTWTGWWREIETLMLERPALEVLASAEAAPFLHGELARLLSDFAREVTKQATLALARGEELLAVILDVPASSEVLVTMASYFERRGEWVARYARAMGIAPPPDRIERMRQRTIVTFRKTAKGLASTG